MYIAKTRIRVKVKILTSVSHCDVGFIRQKVILKERCHPDSVHCFLGKYRRLSLACFHSRPPNTRWSGDVMKKPGQEILMPYPTTTCGPRCCFPIAKTQQINFRVSQISCYWMQRVKVEVEPTRSALATAMLNSKTTPQATSGCGDMALKFLCPGLCITSPDYLVRTTDLFYNLQGNQNNTISH